MLGKSFFHVFIPPNFLPAAALQQEQNVYTKAAPTLYGLRCGLSFSLAKDTNRDSLLLRIFIFAQPDYNTLHIYVNTHQENATSLHNVIKLHAIPQDRV